MLAAVLTASKSVSLYWAAVNPVCTLQKKAPEGAFFVSAFWAFFVQIVVIQRKNIFIGFTHYGCCLPSIIFNVNSYLFTIAYVFFLFSFQVAGLR